MSFSFGGVADLDTATTVANTTFRHFDIWQGDSDTDSVILLSFHSLQAQRIKELQFTLANLSIKRQELLKTGSGNGPGNSLTAEEETLNVEIDSRLNDYVTAIRNYETLSQESVQFRDLILRKRSPLAAFGRKILGLEDYDGGFQQPEAVVQMLQDPKLDSHFRELNRHIREAKMQKKAYSERVWLGAFGGVAVIAPMLLMSLHRDLTTSLVTSSVATLLFGLILAFGASNLKGQEVLGAVAAYAAVLVVFVGTSMKPIS